MRKLSLLFFALWLFSLAAKTQGITAFEDNLNRFFVFDHGKIQQLEHLKVRAFYPGFKHLLYINNLGNLMLYVNGTKHELELSRFQFSQKDESFAYQLEGQPAIKAFYNNKLLLLDAWADTTNYRVSDNLVCWTDSRGTFKVFNGKNHDLEEWPVQQVEIGDNMLAYIDQNGSFISFYNNEQNEIDAFKPKRFKAAKNMVAYVDHLDNFMVFDGEETHELELFNPLEFYVADGMVAYRNELDQLIVFSNGEKKVLLDYFPNKGDLHIKENMLMYFDRQQGMVVYYNNQLTEVERYIPEAFSLDNDMLVYVDLDGKLKGFYKGEKVEISDNERVLNWEQHNHTVVYQTNPFENKVFFNGKSYIHTP